MKKANLLLYFEIILLIILIALPTLLYINEKIDKNKLPNPDTFKYECYAEREGIFVHGYNHTSCSGRRCCCNKLYTCICEVKD